MLQANITLAYNNQYVQPTNITSQQNDKLTTYLADYDSTKLTETDAKKIVSQIQELGIRPGSGLESVLSEAGIDAKSLAEKAGLKVEADRPPPPPPGEGKRDAQGADAVDDAIVTLIADAIEAYAEQENEDETTWSLLQHALENAGYDTSQQLFDLYV